MMDFMVDFGIDIPIPLKKIESHIRSSLLQGVPGWLTSVLLESTASEKFKSIIDLFKISEKGLNSFALQI